MVGNIYNDPQAHKHAIVKRDKLLQISGPLFALMLLPLMQAVRWKEFAAAVNTLEKNIDKYIEYLKQQAATMQVAHHSLTPLRSPGDGTSSHVKFIVGAAIRKPNLIAWYRCLEERMVQMEVYDKLVFLNDFAPPNPRFKYTYLQELSLPFRIEVFTYHYGNNLGSLIVLCLEGTC